MDIKVQGQTVSIPSDCDAIIEDHINNVIHIVKKGEHKQFSRSTLLLALRNSTSESTKSNLEAALRTVGAQL